MIYVFFLGLFINVHSENNRCAPLMFSHTNGFLTGYTQPFTGDYGSAFYIFYEDRNIAVVFQTSDIFSKRSTFPALPFGSSYTIFLIYLRNNIELFQKKGDMLPN